MEENTFSTSAYIAAPQRHVYEYLCELQNLDEWTVFSRMKEQVDEDTWLGSASGYQRNIYYHIRRNPNQRFKCIEWHCGFEHGKYFQVYPVFLFPPDYIEPGSDEPGVYFHWVSFIDPGKRTDMIMKGINAVHTSECRALKAILERRTGHAEWVPGRYSIKTVTIYVDAPVEMAVEHMGDLRNMERWGRLLWPNGEIGSASGGFRDEYGQNVQVTLRTDAQPNYAVIEQDSLYPDHGFLQRAPMLLMPCSYALGNPAARGFMLQRITFWKTNTPARHGKLMMEDYGAELMNVKRILEAMAGNLESFARGPSYRPHV